MNLEKIYKEEQEIARKGLEEIAFQEIPTFDDCESTKDMFMKMYDSFHSLREKAFKTIEEMNEACKP